MPAKKEVQAEEAIEVVKEEAMSAMQMAKARFREAEERVMKYIERDPVRAAMIAAGIGVAIGAATTFALMRRKKKRIVVCW